MIAVVDAFSVSYAKARVKFLEAAATSGLAITSFDHPMPGRDGETLALPSHLWPAMENLGLHQLVNEATAMRH